MKVIYKYELPLGYVTVYMPLDARLLHFGAQRGQSLFVWAEVDTEMPARARHLLVIGTGQDKPDGGEHVGSWVSDEYVWHLFDFGGLPPHPGS